VAAALGDPAREAMIAALIGGCALPAGELAAAAGLSPSGASAHLQKLLDAGIVAVANIAARARNPRAHRSHPSAALCFARSCYTHLAGRLGVALADALEQRRLVEVADHAAMLTPEGKRWIRDLGIVVPACSGSIMRLCLDWTERRRHFSGPIASALLKQLLAVNYVARCDDRRALYVTPSGHVWFRRLGIDAAALHSYHAAQRATGRPLTSAPASGGILRKNGTDSSEIIATPIKAG
jgi:Helix-turn-helix domain